MDKSVEDYYLKARTVGSRVNFDLAPLIKNFSFYDFCSAAKSSDNGAFLVVTNKQYILGYNAGFGQGAHVYAFARCMKELLGGGEIASNQEAFRLDNELGTKYLPARIIYEIYEDHETHQKQSYGYIVFMFANYTKNKEINEYQYEQFLKFYEDYSDEIKLVTKKFNFFVKYTCLNEDGTVYTDESKDLDNVLNYIKSHLVKVDDAYDEIILENSKAK